MYKEGDIGKADKFVAKLRVRDKRIHAHLDYSRTARGPPQSGVKREVFILGEIVNFRLPGSHGSAQSNIWIEALAEEFWHDQKAPQYEPFESWQRAQNEPKYRQSADIIGREHETYRQSQRHGRK